jgi:hypothetical protein
MENRISGIWTPIAAASLLAGCAPYETTASRTTTTGAPVARQASEPDIPRVVAQPAAVEALAAPVVEAPKPSEADEAPPVETRARPKDRGRERTYKSW